MKGDRYQPTASIREVRIGALTIGPEGLIAETDAQAAMFDSSSSLVIAPAAAAPKAPAVKKPAVKKPVARKPNTRKAVAA